ncbi:MAG: hypothetical protein KUG58_00600 [Marinosulfonomonas sp.]|nr:hypothetical protein [Marinosulfonomonas sp.]
MSISDNTSTSGGWLRMSLWIGAAFVACLSVSLINGGPLYYFDSGGYLDNGVKVLRQFGFLVAEGGEGASAAGDDAGANTVNGARSLVYSLLSTVAALGLGASSVPILNAVAILAAIWLPVRVALRQSAPGLPGGMLFALPVLASLISALPFYVAYFMPDIFTGVLLLSVATLAVFARQMQVAEILLAVALGAVAVTSHLSHLAMVALLVVPVLVISLILSVQKWWLAPVLVSAILGLGLAERAVFSMTAKAVGDSQVTYTPFLTARLIEDGAGWRYLQANCPDERIATCILYQALQHSDDPMRLTASHLIFKTTKQLGSYRLISQDDQRRVAQEQVSFSLAVLARYPAMTIVGFLKNTLTQARLNSILMTVPTQRVLWRLSLVPAIPDGLIKNGRLSASRDWIEPVNTLHQVVYSISLVAMAALVLLPSRLSGAMRALSLIHI